MSLELLKEYGFNNLEEYIEVMEEFSIYQEIMQEEARAYEDSLY